MEGDYFLYHKNRPTGIHVDKMAVQRVGTNIGCLIKSKNLLHEYLLLGFNLNFFSLLVSFVFLIKCVSLIIATFLLPTRQGGLKLSSMQFSFGVEDEDNCLIKFIYIMHDICGLSLN